MKRRYLAIAISSALLGSPAPASPAPKHWAAAGGWEIIMTDEGCEAVGRFRGEGRTELTIALLLGGEVALVAVNDNWSAVERRQYTITYNLGGKAFPGIDTVGIHRGKKKGFVSSLRPDFPNALASAAVLEVHLNGTLVDELTLSGSAAAIRETRQCVAELKRHRQADARVAASREQERARIAHIPRDPFRTPEGALVGGPVITRPNWTARPDGLDLQRFYPAAAREAGIGGRATIACQVTSRGTLNDCTIVSEEPKGAGFGEASLLAASKFRMRPTTTDGKPVEGGAVRVPIVWSVEPDEPDPAPAPPAS